MYWFACVIWMGVLATQAAPAKTQTQQQINALTNVAEATAAAGLCPKTKPNEVMMGLSLAYWKIDLDNPKYKSILQKKMSRRRLPPFGNMTPT